MINLFLKELEPDFSNIEYVYSKWLQKQTNITEVEFIDSFKFDNVEPSKKAQDLSIFLAKKRNKVEWSDKDYFNHYLQTKRFGFLFVKNFKSNEYNELNERLKENINRFYYILRRLDNNSFIEFKHDFLDQLKHLENKQKHSKNKKAIEIAYSEIESLNTPPKVKNLFDFIEYLHSNIENFNQYNDLIKELEQLQDEQSQLKPEQKYNDQLQYNKVQTEIDSKFKTLQDNTANLIKAKAKELNVCNIDNSPIANFNGIEAEIEQLKKNFSKENLPEIFKHKSQYLEYRSKTHKGFLSLGMFFRDLDRLTKSLFDYFKDTERNEFEAFENKAIPVNTFTEGVKEFKQGRNFSLPFSSLSHYSKNESLTPQQNTKPKSKQEQPQKLSSIITHEKAETIVSGIKTQYKNIKGKRLKLLLIALQELKLLPEERIAKKFHTLCSKEFDWEVASYNAMNGYNFNPNIDTNEVEGMKQYIKTLLSTK